MGWDGQRECMACVLRHGHEHSTDGEEHLRARCRPPLSGRPLLAQPCRPLASRECALSSHRAFPGGPLPACPADCQRHRQQERHQGLFTYCGGCHGIACCLHQSLRRSRTDRERAEHPSRRPAGAMQRRGSVGHVVPAHGADLWGRQPGGEHRDRAAVGSRRGAGGTEGRATSLASSGARHASTTSHGSPRRGRAGSPRRLRPLAGAVGH
mmetsp:Transcript_11644/g.32867  ORF Transcript_11644/g.32867 Transcript_11644/m.32867 type:complete len:210 (-) Transcript_11644:597-1226(-)